MTFEDLYQEVQKRLEGLDVSAVEEHLAVEFRIRGEAGGTFYVEIKDGCAYAAPYEYYDRDALITATDDTCLKICRHELNPLLAFVVGRVKVQGDLAKLKYFFKKYVDKVIGI